MLLSSCVCTRVNVLPFSACETCSIFKPYTHRNKPETFNGEINENYEFKMRRNDVSVRRLPEHQPKNVNMLKVSFSTNVTKYKHQIRLWATVDEVVNRFFSRTQLSVSTAVQWKRCVIIFTNSCFTNLTGLSRKKPIVRLGQTMWHILMSQNAHSRNLHFTTQRHVPCSRNQYTSYQGSWSHVIRSV